MKRLFLIPIIIFMTVITAYALTWHTANQRTVQWDAVTTNTNGDPIDPAVTEIKYKVFLQDAITGGNPVELTEAAGPITATQYTITLNAEGGYYVGVSAGRYAVDTGELVSESTVSWSDNPAVCQGGVNFGLRYFLAPSGPGGLR